MFQQHTRLSYNTFHDLISVVSPSLEQKIQCEKKNICVKAKIVVALARSSSENSLQN
jgi:hypothetical protein